MSNNNILLLDTIRYKENRVLNEPISLEEIAIFLLKTKERINLTFNQRESRSHFELTFTGYAFKCASLNLMFRALMRHSKIVFYSCSLINEQNQKKNIGTKSKAINMEAHNCKR